MPGFRVDGAAWWGFLSEGAFFIQFWGGNSPNAVMQPDSWTEGGAFHVTEQMRDNYGDLRVGVGLSSPLPGPVRD